MIPRQSFKLPILNQLLYSKHPNAKFFSNLQFLESNVYFQMVSEGMLRILIIQSALNILSLVQKGAVLGSGRRRGWDGKSDFQSGRIASL